MKLTCLKPCTALVRLDQQITTWDREGRIMIPPAYRRQPLLGTVVAVGRPHVADDGTVYRLGVELGDRVYLGPYNGKLVDLGDEHEYRLCSGYNPNPHLQQARNEIPEPETAWPDIYCIIENDDGTPYEGTPSKQELRAWLDSVLGRDGLSLSPDERVSVPE